MENLSFLGVPILKHIRVLYAMMSITMLHLIIAPSWHSDTKITNNMQLLCRDDEIKATCPGKWPTKIHLSRVQANYLKLGDILIRFSRFSWVSFLSICSQHLNFSLSWKSKFWCVRPQKITSPWRWAIEFILPWLCHMNRVAGSWGLFAVIESNNSTYTLALCTEKSISLLFLALG